MGIWLQTGQEGCEKAAWIAAAKLPMGKMGGAGPQERPSPPAVPGHAAAPEGRDKKHPEAWILAAGVSLRPPARVVDRKN